MARTRKVIESEVGEESQVVEKTVPTGLTKFKVLTPVLGYKPGDTFEATYESVKRQLKHKSIEVA